MTHVDLVEAANYINQTPFVGEVDSDVLPPELETDSNDEEPAPDKKHRNSRIRRRIGGVVLCVAGAFGVMNQDKIELAADIGISNAEAAIGSNSSHDLESEFGAGNGLFKATRHGWYASSWENSSTLNALYAQSLLPGENTKRSTADFRKGLNAASEYYWDTSPSSLPPGYDPGAKAFQDKKSGRFDDDNLWMGLIQMREFKNTNDPVQLSRAEQVFALTTSQWDGDGGGIFWKEQLPGETNRARVAVSNAPAVELGVQLYQATGDENYLQWSEKIFDWTDATLKDPKTGLYNDHINYDGTQVTIKRTYVQGTMGGAMAALSQVDPEKYPLQDAINFTNKSLDFFDKADTVSHSPLEYAHGINTYGNSEFDAKGFADFLKVANMSGNPLLINRVQSSLAKALARAPKDSPKLLVAAGTAELQALSKLPENNYDKLI